MSLRLSNVRKRLLLLISLETFRTPAVVHAVRAPEPPVAAQVAASSTPSVPSSQSSPVRAPDELLSVLRAIERKLDRLSVRDNQHPPQATASYRGSPHGNRGWGRGRGRSYPNRGATARECYTCGEIGHFSASCPNGFRYSEPTDQTVSKPQGN